MGEADTQKADVSARSGVGKAVTRKANVSARSGVGNEVTPKAKANEGAGARRSEGARRATLKKNRARSRELVQNLMLAMANLLAKHVNILFLVRMSR